MSRIILATLEVDSASSNDIYSGDLLHPDDGVLVNRITSTKKKWLSDNNIHIKLVEQINYSIFTKTINFYVELDELQATDYYLRF